MEQVNLLPWRQAAAQRQQRAWNCRSLLLLMLLLGGGTAANHRLQHLIQQQQRGWQRAHQQYQRQHAQQATGNTLPLASHQQRQRYQQPLQLLRQLAPLIPAGIYLQQWHWQPPQLTLQGSALSYTVLARFIEALQRDRSIPQLQLSQATTEETSQALVQFCLQGHWPESE